MRRLGAVPSDDLGLRAVVSRYCFDDLRISSKGARKITENWGTWKGLASFYLIIAAAMTIEVYPKTRRT